MPTISVENYLKSMHHLEVAGDGRVNTKALAEHLGVKLPSATRMLQNLAQDGLVEYEPYRGACLSDAGRLVARRVIRAHRLIEVFLVRTLGYEWDEVHDEAERLEHAMSEKLANRIDAFLGYPKFDPHGDPIPCADGTMVRRSSRSLAETLPGEEIEVTRVLDQDPEVLRYLRSVGIAPEARAQVIAIRPFDGTVSVSIDGKHVDIQGSMARALLVTSSTLDADE